VATKAELEKRNAELEARLRAAEKAMGGPGGSGVPDLPLGTVVYLRDPSGSEWICDVGAEDYLNLLEKGSVFIDGPGGEMLHVAYRAEPLPDGEEDVDPGETDLTPDEDDE